MIVGRSVLDSRLAVDGETVWPVSVADVKANAQIDHDADDTLLLSADTTGGIIPAAVEYVERRGVVALITQQRTLYLHGSVLVDQREIELPYGPLQGLVSSGSPAVPQFLYLDTDYAQQVVDASLYRVLPVSNRVKLRVDQSWPSPAIDDDVVSITYECGFGDSAQDVPPRWRHAVVALATYWWNNRDAFGGKDVAAAFLKSIDRIIESAGAAVRYG